MTSKSKNAVRSFETEIEKCREESNWKKAVDLAQQLKNRSPQHESLAHFLIGEGKLEAHLEEWPPIKENIERAQRELSEARGYLTLATDDSGKKAGVALDAYLLLGKLSYACGEYDKALKNFSLAELNTLTEKELPIRSLRIVAESYAIKGMCLEETAVPGSTSKYKQAEREAEMVHSYEISSELTLLYLQRGGGAARARHALDTALRRAPAIHANAGNHYKALERYRVMLSAVECTGGAALRLVAARQLASLLARGLARKDYKPPERVPVPPSGTLSRRREEYYSEGPWKPKKYAAINQFVPQNEVEELLLVVLVGEALAAREAVLSQSAEWGAPRALSVRRAAAVADLLAPPAARHGRLCLLAESLERAMKFSFGVSHVWRQRALVAAAAAATTPLDKALDLDQDHPQIGTSPWRECVKADGVLRRARDLAPSDVAMRLVSARVLQRLGRIDEAIQVAEEALELEEEASGPLLARCHLLAGIGYQLKALKCNSRIHREAASERCLDLLTKAARLDSNDHVTFFHLAAYYADKGMFSEAMSATRGCLRARLESAGGLRLASELCGGARLPLPARVLPPPPPHPARAHEALQAGKELLAYLYSAEAEAEYADSNDSGVGSEIDITSDRDGASVIASSPAGRAPPPSSVSGRTGPGVGGASGAGGVAGAAGGGAAGGSSLAARRAAAWLAVAGAQLRLNRVNTAAGCVAEAAALTPYSHLVFYARSEIHAATNEWEQCKQCCQTALAIEPTHVPSLLQLGTAYLSLGQAQLAERSLRSALALGGARRGAWRRLALVLAAAGDHSAAVDAAAASLAANH